MIRFVKTICVAILVLILTGFLALVVLKRSVEHKAEQKIENVLADKPNLNEPAPRLIFSTKYVYDNFTPAEEVHSKPLLLKLKPYVTNARLPAFLRMEEGALETLYPQGWCNDAARALVFMLKQQGIDAVPWDMVSPVGAHVGVAAKLPDTGMTYLDPTYGVLAMFNKNLIGPFEAQETIMSGADYDSVFVKLDENSNLDFYKEFAETMMSASDQVLQLNMNVPVYEGPLILGQVDGSSQDVQAALIENRMSPHFDYLGHKYDRQWIRSLRFTGAAKISFTLTQDYDPGVMTANKEPTVKERTARWEVVKDEALIFKDGDATLSLSRLNSYIPVDQIIIEPLQ